MEKGVCAIIVTYNRLATLNVTLEKIRNQIIVPDRIIVVDNNSNDGTMDYVHGVAATDLTIRYLGLDHNTGYAGGIARGIEFARAQKKFDYYWIMDDDTLYEIDVLKKLVEAMSNSVFGIIGLDGSNIVLGIKRPVVIKSTLQEVDYVLIDGALVKGEVVDRIGAPYEKFFMMCEDNEYCKRIKREGYKIGLLSGIKMERLFMGGTGKFTKSTLWRGYYQSRNHILILREYFSFADLIGFLYWHSKLVVATVLFAPDRFRRLRFRMIGVWHGLRGIAGKTLDPVTLKFNRLKH